MNLIKFHEKKLNLKLLRRKRKRLRRKMIKQMKSEANVKDIFLETAEAFNAIGTSDNEQPKSTTNDYNSVLNAEKVFKSPSKSSSDNSNFVSKKRALSAESPSSAAKIQKLDENKSVRNTPYFIKVKKTFPSKPASPETTVKNHRHELPIFKVRNDIVAILKAEPTVIFIGDTACGKSTQIPQYILEDGICPHKRIAVTQPRKVAAITIAERVAQEKNTDVGDQVGYCVRFEDVTSASTKIKYMTDGMLLRESIGDPLLMEYGVIILDEAHERSLHTDILFGIVKEAQSVRKLKQMPQLKIIIMSATMDHKHFSKFFNDAPIYRIRGREYKITILNALKSHEDYVFAALATVFKIHQKNDKGDILVFCTGSEEIQSMVAEVRKSSPELEKEGHLKLLPYALYAALPPKQQKRVFEETPEDSRKVIFSTNIAETSITIPGIKYVVDTGRVKVRTFNSSSGYDVLKVVKISKAQAEQRAGRAGREFDGHCYRLYTVEEYQNFRNFTMPEIQRCSISHVILQLVALGVRNVGQFSFLDRPSDENINSAIEELILLGAVKENCDSNNCELTECGEKMVNFPLDPKFSKIIISSTKFRCTDEILTVMAMLSAESLLVPPMNERNMFNKICEKFASKEGDHIMLLNIYKAYKSCNNCVEWCKENFVNYKSMKTVMATRKQLSQICRRLEIPPQSCSSNTSLIRKCLATGMFMNSAQIHNDKIYKTFSSNQKIQIHPSSCLFSSRPSLCIYTELVETSKCYMRTISVVEDEWLRDASPAFFKNKHFQKCGLTEINH